MTNQEDVASVTLTSRLLRRLKKPAKLLVLGVVGWYFVFVLACGILTHRFGSPYAEPTPEGYSGHRLTTQDGLELGAWYRKGEGKTAAILLHGDGSSRSAMFGQAAPYERMNASVLLVTMRAHGDSDGHGTLLFEFEPLEAIPF